MLRKRGLDLRFPRLVESTMMILRCEPVSPLCTYISVFHLFRLSLTDPTTQSPQLKIGEA